MSDTDWSVWDPNSDSKMKAMDVSSEEIESNVMFGTQVDDLAEYELIKIFKYFTFKERIVLRRVCHKWMDCIDKSFKTELVLNTSTVGAINAISEKAICLLIRKCSNVRHIGLNGMFMFKSNETKSEEEVKINDNIIANIVSKCEQLVSIDFGSYDEFDDYFETNAKYFTKVKKIVSKNIGEKALNCIISSENLESIDIRRNDRISRPDFKSLGSKVTELELFDSQVVDECVIKDLVEGKDQKIKVLSIDVKDDRVLSLICKHLKQLKSLKMCLYSQNCNFKEFSNLKLLESLEMEVTDESKLKPEQLNDLIRSGGVSALTRFKVILSPIANIAVNDDSLHEIRLNCQWVQDLLIRGANSLTGAGMYAISQMKSLKHLDLKDCLNITDQIDIVITSCPLLRELILHNCSHITKAVVETFIEKAKTLPTEEFYIDVVDTNVSLEQVLQEPPLPNNLKVLVEYDDCIYDCDHGWDQQNGYNSGPEDDNELLDDLDFYNGEDNFDYYDDYSEEDIEFGL